jgi:gliding motility-associated-like protein
VITQLNVLPITDTTIVGYLCHVGDRYTENGFDVDAVGIHTNTLTGSNGCDSICRLDLRLGNPYDTTYSVLGCNGKPLALLDTIVWNNGTYSFTFQTAEGCDSVINIHASFVGMENSGGKETIYTDEFPIEFDATCNYCYDYQWQSGETSPLISINKEGVYQVTAQSPCGLQEQTIVVIYTLGSDNIFVPNAFTPAASSNNVFRPMSADEFELTFSIYNRYGDLIFESNSIADGWDGTFNGQPCPIGSYVWKMVYRNITHKSTLKSRTGTVMLVR